MIEQILQKLVQFIFLPKIRKAEKYIGHKLVFGYIPDKYIQGWVSWDETKTWQKYGLKLEKGINYWTIGKIIKGDSSRYDRRDPEYESWLGGYVVKLAANEKWSMEDHFKLAIADQNSWLKTFGDPKPMTTMKNWKFAPVGPIENGPYSGTLFEGGCTTHSDVGSGYNSMLKFVSLCIAALFNSSNPNLRLKGKMMRPLKHVNSYETLGLDGYVALFDIEERVKVVLYGNGAMVHKKKIDTDTFLALKDDLLKAMQACKIVKVLL